MVRLIWSPSGKHILALLHALEVILLLSWGKTHDKIGMIMAVKNQVVAAG